MEVSPRTICRLKARSDGTIYSLKHKNYHNNYARKYSLALIAEVVLLVSSLNQHLESKALRPLIYHHTLTKVLKKLGVKISYPAFVKMMYSAGILSHCSHAQDLGDNKIHLPSTEKRVCGGVAEHSLSMLGLLVMSIMKKLLKAI